MLRLKIIDAYNAYLNEFYKKVNIYFKTFVKTIAEFLLIITVFRFTLLSERHLNVSLSSIFRKSILVEDI